MNRLTFLLSPILAKLFKPQDPNASDPSSKLVCEPTPTATYCHWEHTVEAKPPCPHCGDIYPNLIDDWMYDCNECGIIFRKPQHLKHEDQ